MSRPTPPDPAGSRPTRAADGSDATTVRPLHSNLDQNAGSTTRISHFQVRRLLGEGTFGAVYLAFDANLQREVAIKVPKADTFSAEEKAAFLKEARAAADIHHPNVCPVYEANTHEGAPYIVMRFIPSTLEKLLDGLPGTMPVRAALVIARKLAVGLVAAHAKGIIHRDLKPANILYDEANREVLIADFGLARVVDHSAASSTGGGKGTPLYMPPEQWSPAHWGPIGERSDVYSLGVILYEMLTGRPPFTGAVLEVMVAHCQTVPRPPSVARPGLDPALDALCLKALAKHSADRYASAREFALALTNYLNTAGSAKSGNPRLSGAIVVPKPPVQELEHPSEPATLLDDAAMATISGAEAETRGRGRRKLPEPEPAPILESDAEPELVAEVTVRARPKRRKARAGPVRRGPHPAVWIAIAFFALIVAGFVLTLWLDRR